MHNEIIRLAPLKAIGKLSYETSTSPHDQGISPSDDHRCSHNSNRDAWQSQVAMPGQLQLATTPRGAEGPSLRGCLYLFCEFPAGSLAHKKKGRSCDCVIYFTTCSLYFPTDIRKGRPLGAIPFVVGDFSCGVNLPFRRKSRR